MTLVFLYYNPNKNRHVVEEAVSVNIPVMAITDSEPSQRILRHPQGIAPNTHLHVHHLNALLKVVCMQCGKHA